MRAWCPRCDAVRPGETVCPTCATPLTTLEVATAARPGPLPEPPAPEASDPPPPSRLRIALAAATLVVAGLAFVAGRGAARPAAPAATPDQATTTATEPGADARQLGWSARHGTVTLTAVEASRFATDERETVASISVRVQGLPAGQRLLALRGVRLLDTGGGVFSTVDHRQLGRSDGGAPVLPSEHDPDTYTLVTGPAPRLSSLARIELAGLVVGRPRDQTIELDTSGPWPAQGPLRAVDPGPHDAVLADLGFTAVRGVTQQLRLTSAFVGGGRAVVVVDAEPQFRGPSGDGLPLTAELRAGDRVLCERTLALGRDDGQQGPQGVVLACPTRQVRRLTLALGLGVRTIPLEVALAP
jgi:hypothetical protein